MDHKHKRYHFLSHGWNKPKSQIQQADGKRPVGINKIGITPKTLQGSPVLTSSLQGINCKNSEPDHRDVGQYWETLSGYLHQGWATRSAWVVGTASLLPRCHEHCILFPWTATSVKASILWHSWRRQSALCYYMLYFSSYYLIMFFSLAKHCSRITGKQGHLEHS